jgi:uncharacterized protein
MKFQPDRAEGVNLVSRHAPGCVWINAQPFERSVLVPWTGAPRLWGIEDLTDLRPGHFEMLLAMQPELVVFGSGTRLRFAPPALLASLFERRIGVETMDTAAACRTFNVLASEGRRVVAALLVETPVSSTP